MANRDDYISIDPEVGDRDLLTNDTDRAYWPSIAARAIVMGVEVGRPDLLSKRLLGDSSLWWVLLKFNKTILSPRKVKSSMDTNSTTLK